MNIADFIVRKEAKNEPAAPVLIFFYVLLQKKKLLIMFEIKEIPIRDLRTNNGDVEGLPRNPRKIGKKNNLTN